MICAASPAKHPQDRSATLNTLRFAMLGAKVSIHASSNLVSNPEAKIKELEELVTALQEKNVNLSIMLSTGAAGGAGGRTFCLLRFARSRERDRLIDVKPGNRHLRN
jgi:hypothetical protein